MYDIGGGDFDNKGLEPCQPLKQSCAVSAPKRLVHHYKILLLLVLRLSASCMQL